MKFLVMLFALFCFSEFAYADVTCNANIEIEKRVLFDKESSADRECDDLQAFFNPTKKDCKVVDLGHDAPQRWEVFFHSFYDISASSKTRVLSNLNSFLKNRIFDWRAVSIVVSFDQNCEDDY